MNRTRLFPLSRPTPGLGFRLAFAGFAFGWLALAGGFACGTFEQDAKLYTPSASDELGVVTYGGEEEQCLLLPDASKAVKTACVQAVRCDHGRAEAGACPDAGAAPRPFLTADAWLAAALPGALPVTGDR